MFIKIAFSNYTVLIQNEKTVIYELYKNGKKSKKYLN